MTDTKPMPNNFFPPDRGSMQRNMRDIWQPISREILRNPDGSFTVLPQGMSLKQWKKEQKKHRQ